MNGPSSSLYSSSMTLEDFVGLLIDEQAQHVWEHGRYLISRQGQQTVTNRYGEFLSGDMV